MLLYLFLFAWPADQNSNGARKFPRCGDHGRYKDNTIPVEVRRTTRMQNPAEATLANAKSVEKPPRILDYGVLAATGYDTIRPRCYDREAT